MAALEQAQVNTHCGITMMHLSTDDGENSNSQNNIWLKSIPEATTGGDL